MWVEEFTSPEGYVYRKLYLPEYATTHDIGLPELPSLRGMIGILSETCLTIKVNHTDDIILNDYLVYPYQRPAPDEEGYIPEFEIDWDFYNRDVWYPEVITYIGDAGFFKEIWVSDIEVIPYEYNPYRREIKVHRSMEVEVEFDYGFGYDTPLTADPKFIDMYEEFIWNYREMGIPPGSQGNDNYLIITRYEYYDECFDFSEFIELQCGYYCDIYWTPFIGETWSEIRQFISSIYDDYNQKLNYVFLIGDHDIMLVPVVEAPVEDEYSPGIPCDYLYACIKGYDYYPEIAVGRLSIDNADELNFQLGKIMGYYLTPQPPPDPDWRENVLLVAHKEKWALWWQGGSYKLICENIANYDHYDYQQPIFNKAYGEDGHDNQRVKKALEGGVSIVLYRGHGSPSSWGDWNKRDYPKNSWTGSDVYGLTNYAKLPVVLNTTCLNGEFVFCEDSSLAESWMHADDDDNLLIGAVSTQPNSDTRYRLDNEHCQFFEMFFKYVYDYGGADKGFGWLINRARTSELNKYGLNNKHALQNALNCIILGDPALRIRTKTGSTVSSALENKNADIVKDMSSLVDYDFDIIITNPISNTGTIELTLNEPSTLNIDIYDISGRRVSSIYSGMVYEGKKIINFNVDNLSQGLYIINFKIGEENIIRRVVIER